MQGSGAGYGELMLTSLLVLVVVCVVAWAALKWLGRWMEGRRVGSGVTVVGRVPLEPRRSLYVVEAGGRRLLIGSSEGGVTLLTELEAEVAPPEVKPGPRGFAELVSQAIAARVRRRAARRPEATTAPPEARDASRDAA
jgi:flagellar protein FliO/FliZ